MGRELVVCAEEYHILHQHGTPGVHPSNFVIERANREVLDHVRAVCRLHGQLCSSRSGCLAT
eukprot:7808100-Lingulodinium_polyedra.AAC.1